MTAFRFPDINSKLNYVIEKTFKNKVDAYESTTCVQEFSLVKTHHENNIFSYIPQFFYIVAAMTTQHECLWDLHLCHLHVCMTSIVITVQSMTNADGEKNLQKNFKHL